MIYYNLKITKKVRGDQDSDYGRGWKVETIFDATSSASALPREGDYLVGPDDSLYKVTKVTFLYERAFFDPEVIVEAHGFSSE